jgi:NAD(P)-dependent dehydrogenase (short-subunit alcohol dehydrogenase family)
MQVQRKVAMVTGAASGIGAATARAFAKASYDLLLTDLRAEQLAAVVADIESLGAGVLTITADIAARDTAVRCVEGAVHRFGRLDAAVNCAGISGPLVRAAEVAEEAWERTIAINLTAVWRCMQQQIRRMLTQRVGAIVNIASTAGLRGYENSSTYAATKHAVLGLTKSAARDYAADGIRINAICPGFIRTPMTEMFWNADAEVLAATQKAQPLGRMGEAREIGDTAVWLCSEQASFLVGAALVVDGGQIA